MPDQDKEILKWQKRYQREKNARTQAEKLLEEKSSQLYAANLQLKNRVLEESTKFKREEEKFTALFHYSKDGIILHGEDGKVIDANQTICELLGTSADKLAGRHITSLIPNRSGSLLKKSLREINQKGNTRFECDLLDSNNNNIPVEVSATRFQVGNRTIFQGIVRDITANRKAAKELTVATQSAIKANQAKSLFLATMSHEIRTPLNGIIGFTDLLLQSDLSHEHQQHLKLIKKSGDILLSVINDILDFSRTESGQMELEQADYSLTECIEDILDIHSHTAASKKVDLIYFIDPSIPHHLHGDAGRLKQVLLNLVSNGLKFTDKGAITIKVTMPNPEYIEFKVTDTGIGFSENIKQQLFQPFLQADASTTRKYGGTGLGLAICKQLMEAMGGSISANSIIDQGSTFTIILPYLAATNNSIQEAESDFDLKNFNLLILDDNHINLDFMQARLQKWGANVTISSKPQEALKLVSTHSQKFDLLLIDMLMPEIDGFQFAKKLQETSPLAPPPMLLITSSREVNRPQVIELGFKDLVYKPVKENSLKSSIKSALNLTNLPPLDRSPTKEKQKNPQTTNKLALVVEDNPINAKLAMLLLQRLGINTHIAINGQEALLNLLKDVTYDIIFMDMQMPVMDGLEATKRIRHDRDFIKYKNTPIIAMTANVLPEDQARCLAAGMNGYVTKPIDREVIKRYLTTHQVIS